MRRAGNCYDHARMERLPKAVSRNRLWATLKGELIGDHVFATRAEAKSEIFRYIEVFYNRTRLHGALGYQSPVDFENQLS